MALLHYRGFLLWLQFAYAVWQFVRVAKFFRLPSALIYHAWLWLTKTEFQGGKPFSRQKIVQIIQGRTWTYQQENYLRHGDRFLNAGHYLQERRGVNFVVSQADLKRCNVLDRQTESAGDKHMSMFLCNEADLIVPNFYIGDVYDWPEGMDKFLMDGAGIRIVNARVLLMSSREHFLNQNFMRLLAILPLMLQAKRLDTLSLYASLVIILLDQLSYPANRVWLTFVDFIVDLTKLSISRIRDTQKRLFLSTFMATMSPRLSCSDQVLRNFYFVRRKEYVLLFGTSYAECFDIGSLEDVQEPSQEELNPFVELAQEDYETLNTNCQKDRNVTISIGFDIHIGSSYVEHRVHEGRIMTFFRPQQGAYYNFLDHDHLHYGFLPQGQEDKVRKALKWIEKHGKLPVIANHRGQLRAVSFNDFVDSVARGCGLLRARVKKGTWV